MYRKFSIKKTVKYIFWTIFSLVIIYSLAWFIMLVGISTVVNKEYAGKQIDVKDIGIEKGYFIKFGKIKFTGFPFKIAFKIIDWQEESTSNKIEYSSPIIFGYDFLKESIFVNYSGEVNAWYKPLQAGFGTRIVKDDYKILFKLPLSAKFLRNIFTQKNWFESLNFLKTLEFSSRKVQMFDMINKELLYDIDNETTKFTINKRKFYTDINDFIANIPDRIDVSYSVKVNQTTMERKISPENLLHGVIWPVKFDGTTKFYIKTDALTFNNLQNDIEVGFTYLPSDEFSYQIKPEIFYKHKNDEINTDLVFRSKAYIFLKLGFIDSIFSTIKYIIANTPTNIVTSVFKNQLEYIVDNRDKFDLQLIENRGYDLDLDFNFARRAKDLKIKVNNFAIFSGKTGIRFTNESDIVMNKPRVVNMSGWGSKGAVVMNNYDKIVDIIFSNAYVFIKNDSELEKNRKLYVETAKYFLKNISDHPDSKSNDLGLEYLIDSKNLEKSKIGSTELGKIKILYYLALYKKTLEQIKSGDDLFETMRKFAPELNQEQKQFLERLMLKPLELNSDTWRQLIE